MSIYFSAHLEENALIPAKTKIQLFDASGKVVENDTMYKYLRYDQISPTVFDAFIALEDKRFYRHKGVDYYRVFGALWKDISTLSFREGGSTITQQLAKNTQLTPKKTFSRKIKEMRLAHLIEKRYSKESILEMYVNAIYFGNGIYGIDSAAKNYFSKSAIDLTVEESALLAGIVKNPSAYSPYAHPNDALKRRNLVLSLLRKQGYISDEALEKALNVSYSPPDDLFSDVVSLPYYRNALSEASNILSIPEKELIRLPYKIVTFYDPHIQQCAFDTFQSDDYAKEHSYHSILVADNTTCGISAFYTDASQLNIFTAKRQPGSVIKPVLVYGPAFEYGVLTPQTCVLDEKIDINGYSPKNYKNTFKGWMTVKNAIALSVNTIAVKTLHAVGFESAKQFASACGIKLDQSDGLSAALGGLTNGSTQAELLEAYQTIANGGKHQAASFIQKITDKSGKTIYKNPHFSTIAMSSDTAYLLTDTLRQTVIDGTASKLSGFSYEIASKTGTAQSVNDPDNQDAWNISFTPEKTVIVWYGAEEKHSIPVTGSGLPTMLARKIYSLLPPPAQKQFTIPTTIISTEIDAFAINQDHKAYLINAFTPEEYRKTAYFSIKNSPTEISPYFDVQTVRYSVILSDDAIIVDISSPYEYEYVLEQRNISENTLYSYSIPTSGQWTFRNVSSDPFVFFRLGLVHRGKIVSYVPERIPFMYANNG